jgi:hypothetical protein
MSNAEPLGQQFGLRSLAGARRADQQEARLITRGSAMSAPGTSIGCCGSDQFSMAPRQLDVAVPEI